MATTNKDYIYRIGAAPNTKTAVSQKNKVFAHSTGSAGLMDQIGNLGNFSISESRGMDPVRGVGFGDQVAEIVPSVTEPMTISVSRAMLYLQNFFQTLGYKGGAEGLVRSLKHHRWPFDIKQELVLSHLVQKQDVNGQLNIYGSAEQGTKAIFTFFEACWIQSVSAAYPADSAIVNEDLELIVSDVFDNHQDYSKIMLDNDNTSTDKASEIIRSTRYNSTNKFRTSSAEAVL